MFQMGGIGPMMGQANVWYRYWNETYQPAIDRYQNEVKRLFGVLDSHLKGRQFLTNELSIADIANWAWVRIYDWSGIDIKPFPHLQRWVERLNERPAFHRGINQPAAEYEQEDKATSFVKGARNMLTK